MAVALLASLGKITGTRCLQRAVSEARRPFTSRNPIMSMSLLVLISLFAALVFWAVGAYNRLVRLRNTIANAFGQIDVQLKRRYDLIPNLVEAAKKYLLHEQSTLEAVIAARNQARSASDAVRSRPTHAGSVIALAAAEQALSGSLGHL